MADGTTVVEGKVKYREGKKWKPRWCVLKKPSPVADRLQLVLYKDVHEALKSGGKVKTSFPLDGYYGLESGFELERESNVLAIVCHKHVTLFAFDTREYLIQFEVKIRRSLGQEYQFPVRPVKVPTGSRLPQDNVKLLIHGPRFCMTGQVPPRILQCWNVADIRRFDAVDGKFCFEGGSRCGKGSGIHAVRSEQADEITEILRVNSLGKTSAGARLANNRSSQLMDYSLAAPDPFWTQSNNQGGPGAGAGTSAVGPERSPMLMCCQALPGDGGDEWGCRKRHSVSVTEFHRAGATTFQEKLRMMSIENQERQRLMAIYDVPPKHNRKLEAASGPNSAEKSAEGGVSAASSLASLPGAGMMTSTARVDPHDPSSHVEAGHNVAASSRRVMVTSVAGREYCIPRSLNTSIFDSMVNAQVDTTKRNEALQNLQKQETHLHEEIVLLDQMLQSCSSASKRDSFAQSSLAAGMADSSQTGPAADSMDPWQDKMTTLEPPLKCSTPAIVAQKAASLPPKMTGKRDSYLNVPSVDKPGTFPASPESRAAADTPLSPNLMSKLELIPWNSHLNAPLPYVNLAKYDSDLDTGFVYLAGSEDADSGCVAVPSMLRRYPVGGSLASLRNRAAVGLVPSRCFSDTYIGPGAAYVHSSFAPHKPLPSPPKEEPEEGLESVTEGLVGSTEMLDIAAVLLPPTTYAPPVPYPRPLTTLASSTTSAKVDSLPAYQVPVVTAASVPAPTVSTAIREPIYANEPPPLPPPRSKLDTPPPELPPKGPALLRRSKLRSSGSGPSIGDTVPPVPPVRTRSLSVGSPGKFGDYDNQPGLKPPPVPPSESKRGQVEENYLPMGSPKTQHRREVLYREGDSRPSSLYVTSSPKPRAKGVVPPARRGNADVLSGYMDMANMFIEEPKPDRDRKDAEEESELYVSEPVVDASTESALPPDSNYMEMSSFSLETPAKRKSAVLKNLEALQTYVSTTAGGEPAPKPEPSDPPATPVRSSTPTSASKPDTPSRSSTPNTPSHLSNTPSRVSSIPITPSRVSSTSITPKTEIKPSPPAPSVPAPSEKGVFKIYSRLSGGRMGSPSKGSKSRDNGGAREKHKPAMPFTNLKSFEHTHNKPAYVNTYIPAPEVPLPEPPKKEEGFFARLIRRNSKDRIATQSQENLNFQKNRTSVFERSMSERAGETADEKANNKLKVGRRRSASFPNRLSFQETSGSAGATANAASRKDAPPPLPPSAKSSASIRSSSSIKSTSSSSIKFSSKQVAAIPQDNKSKPRLDHRSDNSSVHDLSDDSDMAPLLRHGSSKSEMRVLTVLHVQQDMTVNPMANICSAELTHCSSVGHLSSKWSDISSTKHTDSSFSLSDSSKTALSDSSKTDDEKLIALFEQSKRQSMTSDIDVAKSKMSLPLDHGVLSPKEEADAIARHVATIPPLIPPKSKKLLSPVSEVSSPGSQSLPSPAPPSPPTHPVLPSAPNEDEAIYVDMKELLPQPPRGPASPTHASLHPYNSPSPREQKELARATLRITAAVEDEEGNIWVPRHGAGGIRHPPFAKIEPPPPLPGLSPRLPPDFAAQLSPRLAGEFHANLSELRFTTPLVVSIDPLEEDGDGLVDQQSLSSSQGSCLSLRSCMDDHIIPASPAATVLRPRSGRDYQVVERRRVGSDSFSSSSPAPHSPACSSSVFTYERYSLPHRSTATLSLSSGPSREPSPGGVISTHPSTPSFSLSKERTTPTPVSVSVLPKDRAPSPKLFTSVENPLPLPPRTYRMCRRAQSEPSSAKTESPSSVPQSARSSPPSTPQLQNFPFTLCPEMLEPMLNYAEIDLTAAASTPPPVELTRHLSRHLSRNLSRRQKKPPVAVEYTQIDHTATSALKKAGEEHALSREEYNSLRRGSTATSLSRKNSAPTTNKDRRGFSSFSRERKLSSCSVDSV
ncbi:serine/arginine repetitive matrix protein 2-like [Littorina saxatilis]|uniref:IRS-type PTB domain-containing protein n=1 Tax=Littorina saxatilis TaxID=31220 RepID=A0AAN9BUE3_9CAEN